MRCTCESAELLPHDLAHLRVLVHGEDDLHVGELLRELLERLVDMAHGLAEILAAMRRHEDHAFLREVDALEQGVLKMEIILHRMM